MFRWWWGGEEEEAKEEIPREKGSQALVLGPVGGPSLRVPVSPLGSAATPQCCLQPDSSAVI